MNYPILDGSYIYDKITAKIENGEDINVYEQFYLWSIHNRSKILYGLFILFISCLIINDITEYRQNRIVIQSGGASASANITPITDDKEPKGKSFGSKLWSGTKAVGKGIKRFTFGKNANVGSSIKGFGSDVWKGTKSVGTGIKNVVVGKNAGEDLGKVGQALSKGKRSFTKNISFRGKRDPSKMSQYELERYKKLEETKANRKYKKLGAIKDVFTFFPLIDKFFGKIWNFLIDTKAGIIIGFILLVYGFGVVVIPLLLLYLLVKYTLKVLKKKTQSLQDYNVYKKLTSRR